MNSLLSLTVLCLVIVSCLAWPAVPEQQQQQKQHKVGKLVSFLVEGDSSADVEDKIRKVRQTITDVNVDVFQGGAGGGGGGYGGYGGFGGNGGAGFQQQVPFGYGAYGATPGGGAGVGGYGGYGGYGGAPAGYQQTDVDVVVDNYGK